MLDVEVYSKAARQDVHLARTLLKAQGLTGDGQKGVRASRKLLRNTSNIGSIVASNEFYSTSALQDLLWNVEDHDTTWLELRVFQFVAVRLYALLFPCI